MCPVVYACADRDVEAGFQRLPFGIDHHETAGEVGGIFRSGAFDNHHIVDLAARDDVE